MAQQTAVELLEKKLKTYLSWSSFLEEDFQEAKEMEKEQIMESRNSGIVGALKGYSISNEDYYNETYGKE